VLGRGQYRNAVASGKACVTASDPTLPRYGTDLFQLSFFRRTISAALCVTRRRQRYAKGRRGHLAGSSPYATPRAPLKCWSWRSTDETFSFIPTARLTWRSWTNHVNP